MKLNECQYYKQQVFTDHNRDRVYEGTVMCSLVDKPCLVEYGNNKCADYFHRHGGFETLG